MEQAGVQDVDRSRMVMVGDREHDVFGAKEQGNDCVGVLFGYGSREELEAAGTWKIAADMDELTKKSLMEVCKTRTIDRMKIIRQNAENIKLL